MRRLMVRLMFSMFLAATPLIAHAQAVTGSSSAGGATSDTANGTAGGTVGGATVSTSGGARGAAVEPVSIIAAGLGLAGAAIIRRLRKYVRGDDRLDPVVPSRRSHDERISFIARLSTRVRDDGQKRRTTECACGP